MSPSSAVLRCVPWRLQTKEVQPSWDAAAGTVRSLSGFAAFAVDSCCWGLRWLVHFSAMLQAPHQGGLSVPSRSGVMAKRLCLGWSFVLPWLYYRGGCSEQRSLLGNLWNHCDAENQSTLARALPFRYCMGKSPNLSVT